MDVIQRARKTEFVRVGVVGRIALDAEAFGQARDLALQRPRDVEATTLGFGFFLIHFSLLAERRLRGRGARAQQTLYGDAKSLGERMIEGGRSAATHASASAVRTLEGFGDGFH